MSRYPAGDKKRNPFGKRRKRRNPGGRFDGRGMAEAAGGALAALAVDAIAYQVTASMLGSSITLCLVGPTEWFAIEQLGIWTTN
jgi:hypothetical protein